LKVIVKKKIENLTKTEVDMLFYITQVIQKRFKILVDKGKKRGRIKGQVTKNVNWGQ
jgi:hypothetical protein